MNLNREVTKTDKFMAITLMMVFYVGLAIGVYILPTYPLIGTGLLAVGAFIALMWGAFSLNYLKQHDK